MRGMVKRLTSARDIQASLTDAISASQSFRGYVCQPSNEPLIIGYEQLSPTSQPDIQEL